MEAAGIIAEYNPLHGGHVYLMEEARHRLGPEAGLVCVMSGNYVQRGDLAVVEKRARAAAAVRSGADLVLELPLPWAVSPAEDFAHGAVRILMETGVVDRLVFGSETGDAGALDRAAEALLSPGFPAFLREELQVGDSFPAARQRAVERLTSREAAAVLARPNDILGVEYCKALRRLGSAMKPLAVPRKGSRHDGPLAEGGPPPASAIRGLLRAGRRQEALAAMAPAMAEAYVTEEAAGRAPVFWEACERGVLARLRGMDREAFLALDRGREGLGNRLWRASREAPSLEEVLALAKTKRYPLARLRRMALWAWLEVEPWTWEAPAYLRPLAANRKGRELLGRMRKRAGLPILTRPAQLKGMPEEARRLFALEARGTDLYALAYPSLEAGRGGAEWKSGPVML